MSFKAQNSDHKQSSSDSLATQCGSRRQVGVSLDVLFSDGERSGKAGTLAKSCTSDWQQVQPGDVFVALDNGEQDGHEDARDAVARGAVAVVCERLVPVFNVPVYVVSDSRAAYSELCQALVGPSKSACSRHWRCRRRRQNPRRLLSWNPFFKPQAKMSAS